MFTPSTEQRISLTKAIVNYYEYAPATIIAAWGEWLNGSLYMTLCLDKVIGPTIRTKVRVEGLTAKHFKGDDLLDAALHGNDIGILRVSSDGCYSEPSNWNFVIRDIKVGAPAHKCVPPKVSAECQWMDTFIEAISAFCGGNLPSMQLVDDWWDTDDVGLLDWVGSHTTMTRVSPDVLIDAASSIANRTFELDV